MAKLDDMVSSLTWLHAFFVILATYFSYWIAVFVYRITFHPLARFPGPRLAGATFWYEFYYDLWPQRYRYMWKIKDLHERYGPIVRINPNHLHINDPDYLDEIYAGGRRKRNRDPWYSHATETGPMSWSLMESIDHDVHRMRRAALNPFFSKRAIQQLEGMIMDKVDSLVLRFGQSFAHNKTVNLTYSLAALTSDVVSAYALGSDLGNLRRDDWGREWLDAFRTVGLIHPIGRQFKWLVNLSFTSQISPDAVAWISPQMAAVARKLMFPMDYIQANIAEYERNGKKGALSANDRTIFQDIIASNLPESEKTAGHFNAHAALTLGAGTETTARTLAVTIYFLLRDTAALEHVRQELRTVMQTPDSRPTLAELESLPFFSACITEGLRLGHGASSRMPRVATEEALLYKEWVIPANTPVMQSMYLHHTNSTIFPQPFSFVPQRWLDDPKLKPKYFMAYGRGSRSCIGLNLASAELYFTIAHVLRRYDMELYDTIQERDVDVLHDCFIGVSHLESPGIQG
ncbi:putative Cytochrome P450 [Seiridium cardinale]